MANAWVTATVDLGGLQRAIPQIVSFARRTMLEQCVTSAAYICRNAVNLTPKTTAGEIDAELNVKTIPILSKRGKRKGLPLKSGKSTIVQKAGMVPLAALIVASRARPAGLNRFGKPNFNLLTGGRWALAKNPFKGVDREAGRQAMAEAVSRMVKARHSSTNFLQAGWKPAIRRLMSDPNFRGTRGFQASENTNPLNKLKTVMGNALVAQRLNDVMVTAHNDVGELEGRTNRILSARHRIALIYYGLKPLQEAVDMEVVQIQAEISRRLALGWKQYPALNP